VSKASDLLELEKCIKESELTYKSIQTNIDQQIKEIHTLTKQRVLLEGNLEFHKRAGIIPIAHEYGKTKKELTKVINRLTLVTDDHKKAVKGLSNLCEIIDKFKRDHAELSNSNDNNVVRALFGARRGKK
jgi:hypothetical protein